MATIPDRPHPLALRLLLPSWSLLLTFLWVLSLVGASYVPVAAKPPEPYALIFGTVWSPQNQTVSGVKIKIRRAGEKKFRWELVSNSSGEFAQRVPAGKADYEIVPDLRGFKSLPGRKFQPLQQPVVVHIENDERVDTGVHLME